MFSDIERILRKVGSDLDNHIFPVVVSGGIVMPSSNTTSTAIWARSKIMSTQDRKDPQPEHGKGLEDGKGQPVEHGRPIKPHRSSAIYLGKNTWLN